MPERPDLEYVVSILHKELSGAVIGGIRIKKPVVLRMAVAGAPAGTLTGMTVERVWRRGHFVLFDLNGNQPRQMVVNLMLAGRFTLARSDEKSPADLALAVGLQDGRELRYRDDLQMGKVYIIDKGAWQTVPGLEMTGLDVLNPKVFTRAAFRAIARKRRDQLKVFLMDKSALDALGNAYADEVLFAAGLHPKTFARLLSDDELHRLHGAIVRVLRHATDEIARRRPPMDEKVRDFLKVRNRHGEPCPKCGSKIRRAGVRGHAAFFCPTCQPETRRGSIVDWRRIPSD
jgi:formamidopyrimidine-DNA glycosylase